MLRFKVYDDNGPATAWPLVNAYLVGPNDVPAAGRIAFKDGVIHCRTRAPHAVALCLQHDAGRMGRLMLQTCLLPDRQEPYGLTIELARHRIKTFIAKSEEWMLFDLDPDHPAVVRWEKARNLFSEVVHADDPVAAEPVARQSLMVAIEATERLALAHAEILLHWRYAKRPASSTTLGVRARRDRDSPALREIVKRDFDLLVVPLNWSELEVEEGKFDWAPIDAQLEWARQEGKPVVLGPLLNFSRSALPQWMYVWQHDYATCRDMVYEQVERVVHRYRGLVGTWNIASGINTNSNFEFTTDQMLDLTRMASLIARQARKGARTMVEITEPFGEHCVTKRNSLPPLTFVERLCQDGIRVDCVGVQMLFGQREGGRCCRDLMVVSDALDRYATLELPVVLSAFGVPHESIDEQGGWWREPWTPQVQSRWMARMFAIALSKPFIDSVIWTDLYDHRAAGLPQAGLVTDAGQPKPVLERLVSTRRRMRKPLGPLAKPLLTGPRAGR